MVKKGDEIVEETITKTVTRKKAAKKKPAKRKKTTKKKSKRPSVVVRKKKPKKKRKTTRKEKPVSQVERLLIENLVVLQKILANLTVKFDGMAEQIAKLLALFEISAKSFVEKQGTRITKEDKAFLEKLDNLIDQNKTIAKGLTLMEERLREKVAGPGPVRPRPPARTRPLPRP